MNYKEAMDMYINTHIYPFKDLLQGGRRQLLLLGGPPWPE
jgi:hypothetical protein